MVSSRRVELAIEAQPVGQPGQRVLGNLPFGIDTVCFRGLSSARQCASAQRADSKAEDHEGMAGISAGAVRCKSVPPGR